MDSSVPTVTVTLWSADAIVLLDWLERTDLNTVPIEHPAEKQALTDLYAAFEVDVPQPTESEVAAARTEVARDMDR